VPNKLFIQVKSQADQSTTESREPVEFSKTNLVLKKDNGDTEIILEDIKHVHEGRASFVFTPERNAGGKYMLQVFK
jgi:hypothetical protein